MLNRFQTKSAVIVLALAALLLIGSGTVLVSADDHEHEGHKKHRDHKGSRLIATNATFQAECSACHLAYPPHLLPAVSWREIMGTLDKHFGSDASLDEATIAEILPFLEQNAAIGRKAEISTPPVLRITETRWFARKHDDIDPAIWRRESIKSASNCMACHTRADQGDFDEDNVRIPK